MVQRCQLLMREKERERERKVKRKTGYTKIEASEFSSRTLEVCPDQISLPDEMANVTKDKRAQIRTALKPTFLYMYI